jgi:hypothetical protein
LCALLKGSLRYCLDHDRCLNVSANIDTTFVVEYLVFDNALSASVFRTITIVSPCTTKEVLGGVLLMIF